PVLFVDLGATNITLALDSIDPSYLDVEQNGGGILAQVPLTSFTGIQVDDSGTVTWDSSLATTNFPGGVSISGSTICVGGNITTGTVNLAGNVQLNSNVTISYGSPNGLAIGGGTVNLQTNTLTLTDTATTDAGNVTGQITGSGALVKAGPGTLT